MWEDFKYFIVTGISRMLVDIGDFISPAIYKLYPVLRYLSSINIWVVSVLYVVLLYYLIFIRHHHIVRKLRKSSNYFMAGILLFIYILVSETPVRIGQVASVNVGLVVMPLAAKFFGPVLAGLFGIIQYATSFAMHQGEAFNVSALLVAGISGMLYGRIIYLRRTSYIRCLKAKLLVNIVCNIILVPRFNGDTLTPEVLNVFVQTVAENILLAPIQALMIFVALIIVKKVKNEFNQIPWGIAK